jgi:cyanophycin synthetase
MSKKTDIALLRINYLRGPNVWTYRPVLEVWLDLGELEQHPSHLLPGFNARLTALLPALIEHHCGVGERGGFLERLEEGTWAGHILEHVVIELLNLAGMPTGFGQTRSTSQPGVYRMVFRARDEQVAREALAHGHRLLMAAINDEPFDVDAAVAAVRDRVDACYLGPSTASIVAAATDRGIPHLRLNEGNLVQLGHGKRQRRIWTAETDLTSAIAEGIARDKDLTKTLISAVGVPVPEGQAVASAAEAWEAAQDIGLPVVVKPSDGNHGRGVTLDLNSEAEVAAAFDLAQRHGSEVLVERFVRGEEHRLLVVGGKVVAAARGESAWITGDGHATVNELIDRQINTDPRRGVNEDFPLNRIIVAEDEAVQLDLERQGLSPTAVPVAGRRVLIQRNGNVAIDCTDDVHPDVAHLVALAARVVGLDIAGIDVVAQDISKPLAVQGGAVVEVNAGPGLLMHLKPAEGMPRPVGQAIVDHLFPHGAAGAAPDDHGRIPIVGVAGSRGTTTIARLVAWLLQLSGRHVGLACREGLFFGSRRVERGDCAHWEAGNRLLINREVDAVVIEAGAKAMLQDGLAYDRCKVGVVTDLGGVKALADHDVADEERLAHVLRTQVDVVLPDGVAVLNAAVERVAAMARFCDGDTILYGLDAKLPAIAAQLDAGGRAVFVQHGRVMLAHGRTITPCVAVATLARALATPADEADPTEIVLAAAATAWGLGMAPELIAAGLETFVPAQQQLNRAANKTRADRKTR